MRRVSKDTIAAVRAQERAEIDAHVFGPRFLLICDLMGAGARIIEEAAVLRGGDAAGVEASLDSLRRAVAKAAKSFAAYDASIEAGRSSLSNAEWSMLCNGDRRVVSLNVRDFDGAIEVHT